MPVDESRGWHSRGYLPHIDAGEQPLTVTYRLADALPQAALIALDAQVDMLPAAIRDGERRKRIEAYLDAGHGEALFTQPELAAFAEEPLLFHDGERYRLHAWVVMPNHVHVLMTPLIPVGQILNTWKSFSALKIHRHLQREGRLWQPDYFDRLIRNEEHFLRAVEYIENNPVKAGLCTAPYAWQFGSAFGRTD